MEGSMARLPQGPTKIIVGAFIGSGLVWAFYRILDVEWFLVALLLLAVEVWSFFNPYEHDTISEVVWGLSERPLVPLLFGVALGWAITSGFIPVTIEGLWISVFLGTIMGHFFWQRQEDRVDNAIKTLSKVEPARIEAEQTKLHAINDVKDAMASPGPDPAQLPSEALPLGSSVEVEGQVKGTLHVQE